MRSVIVGSLQVHLRPAQREASACFAPGEPNVLPCLPDEVLLRSLYPLQAWLTECIPVKIWLIEAACLIRLRSWISRCEPHAQGLCDDDVTVQQFCTRYVEPMGEESDHIQLVALTDALLVSPPTHKIAFSLLFLRKYAHNVRAKRPHSGGCPHRRPAGEAAAQGIVPSSCSSICTLWQQRLKHNHLPPESPAASGERKLLPNQL